MRFDSNESQLGVSLHCVHKLVVLESELIFNVVRLYSMGKLKI